MIYRMLLISLFFFSFNLFADNSFDEYYRLESEAEQLNARYTELTIHWKEKDLSEQDRKKMKQEYDQIVDDYSIVAEKMKKLEEILNVKAWFYQLDSLKEVSSKFQGDIIDNRICDQNGKYQYFIDNKSFERWNADHGNIDKKIEYYSRKDPYISTCLQYKKNGNSEQVSGTYRKICKRYIGFIGTYNSTSYNYKVEKKNGQIAISAKIFVKYRGKPELAADSLVLLFMAKPCMENFYAKHGIKLNLEFEPLTNKSEVSSKDLSINLYDEYERANSYNWITHTTSRGKKLDYSLDNSERCSMYIHELGPLFGLTDAYPDPDCPDRKNIGPDDDIMNDSWRGPDYTKFYENEIKQLLSPLCEK